MGKEKLAKKVSIALGFVGLAMVAPKLIPFLALASKDYFGESFSSLFDDKDTEESWGKIGINVFTGLLTEFTGSVAEDIPKALSEDHNSHLEVAIATAYLESFNVLTGSIKETKDSSLLEQGERYLPLLKARVKRTLKEKDPSLLFPAQYARPEKVPPTEHATAHRLSAENLVLSLDDADKMRRFIADEIEITLRRWLNEERAYQKGELGLNPDAPFPEPLRSYLRSELLPELQRRMGNIVTREEFKEAWVAYQRAHLQAVFQAVNKIQGSQHTLVKKFEELTKHDTLAVGIATHLSGYLSKARLPRAALDNLLQGYRSELAALEDSVCRRISESTERLSTEGGDRELRLSGKIDARAEEIINEVRRIGTLSALQQIPASDLGGRKLSEFWDDWAKSTDPVLHYDLVIAGREEARNSILEWLRSAPSAFILKGDSTDEATAFLAAVAQSLDEEERAKIEARAVMVEDASSWRRLAQSPEPLIIITKINEPEGVGRAIRNGHHVFVPMGGVGAPGAFTLSRIVRSEAERSLKIMGISDARSRSLATLARRSLSALRRKLAIAPGLQCPTWARPDEARHLLAPLVVGVWHDSSEGDRAVLSRLADIPYQDIQRNAVRLANEPDPPLRREGDIWMIAAREDAWRLIACYLTADDLKRFEGVALDVLGERDPSFDLPAEKRYAASIYGKVLTYTGFLREGIAETLALMATLSPEVKLGASITGEEFARRVVGKLLHEAKEKEDLWSSLAYLLPLLAEAAPSVFLDAMDEGLAGENPPLVSMFQDGNRESVFGGSSPHTGLLWALETLAWSPAHLARTSLSLARLVRLDPGGHLVNRPMRSLWEIFVCGNPNTAAPINRRLAVIDTIRKREPKVAWRLLVRLLSDDRAASPTHKTRWRDWVPDPQQVPTDQEYIETSNAILERLLSDVREIAPGWCDLINLAGDLTTEQRELFFDRLEELDPRRFSSEDQEQIRICLRKIVSRHRDFPNADWAMPGPHVDRLEGAIMRFEPADIIIRHRWLFEQYVELPALRRTHWRNRMEVVQRLRTEAIQDILSHSGWEGMIKFAGQVKEAENVGFTLGASDILPIEPDEFLAKHLGAPEPWRKHLVRGYVRARANTLGESWITERLAKAASRMWTPEQYADLFLYLPFVPAVINLLDKADEQAQRFFWGNVEHVGLFEDAVESDRVIARLLHFGRPHAAVGAIEWALNQQPDLVSPERIAEVLEASIQTAPGAHFNASDFARNSAELLNRLEKTGMARERLAKLEWLYLRVHEHYRRPHLLHNELSNDPEFFIDVLKHVYKAKSESGSEHSEESAALSRLGEDLLDSWKQLPGRQGDDVDEEALRNWVDSVREFGAASDRLDICDIYIGQSFAFSPADPDGLWPHRIVRELIEEASSPVIERAWRTQIINNRGITSRRLTDGGAQERDLATRYEYYAEQFSDFWLRTSAVLKVIADDYRRQGEQEDHRAEITQDFWH